MPDYPVVNTQVTDAVTQTNVKVLGEAPAQSMAMLYQIVAASASISAQNAVHQQQGLWEISSAIVGTASKKIMDLMT
jgi:Killing trait